MPDWPQLRNLNFGSFDVPSKVGRERIKASCLPSNISWDKAHRCASATRACNHRDRGEKGLRQNENRSRSWPWERSEQWEGRSGLQILTEKLGQGESTDAHPDPLEELTPSKGFQVMVDGIHEKWKGLTLGYGFIEVEQRIGHEKPGCQFHLVQTG